MKKFLIKLADIVLPPILYPCGLLLKEVRRVGLQRLPNSRKALLHAGVFPIRNHYYEPQFDFSGLKQPMSQARPLPGIDLNVAGQLALLQQLTFAPELADLAQPSADPLNYRLDNTFFSAGDAEYWYQLIRLKKPRRIIEIGSGNSTLMAARAIRKNREEDGQYQCAHICIEPYEAPWLEQIGVQVLRQRVEDIELSYFKQLQDSDILFIDSSHMIRPEGDVVFEFLQLLPSLNAGVIVHVHDIFTPSNYPHDWLVDEVKFWNEQYLLEAFLTHNAMWKILGGVSYLQRSHFDLLKQVAPYVTPQSRPTSFYLQKVV